MNPTFELSSLPLPIIKSDWVALDVEVLRAARAKLRGLFELPDNQVLRSDLVTPMEFDDVDQD